MTFYIPNFQLMEKPGGYDWFVASLKTALLFKSIISSLIAGLLIYIFPLISNKIKSKK